MNFYLLSPVETSVMLESNVTPAQSKKLQEAFNMVEAGQVDAAFERVKQQQ